LRAREQVFCWNCRHNVDIFLDVYALNIISNCIKIIKMKKMPIAHYTGGVGVVGSNPAAPTNLFCRQSKI
jgi:hypothetical protein